jgi:hypothetical protein
MGAGTGAFFKKDGTKAAADRFHKIGEVIKN